MEIISIPLEGSLVHEDNMGHKELVSAGEIQVMSTGSNGGDGLQSLDNMDRNQLNILAIGLLENEVLAIINS